MPIIQDEEFGKVTIRRSLASAQVRIKIAPDGTIRASLPMYAPIFLVKRLLKNSRAEIREMISKSKPDHEYISGMQVGKSHTLIIKYSNIDSFKITTHGQQIIVSISDKKTTNDPIINRAIRDAIIKALRIEAKSYLPRRLSYIAEKLGFSYSKVRFSHSSGRWGSCSSNKTISLNIALMKLPLEIIDYVLIHELCHLKEMNHGENFWNLVGSIDPDYKLHRKQLKQENPNI